MKKHLLLIMMACILALVGCASKPAYETALQVPDKFKVGEEIPLTLTVKQNNQPVTGLVVTAHLEMKKMDHGTVDVTFAEKENGEYRANAKLPMGGEWVAFIQLKTGKNSVEQEIGFTTEGIE